MSPFSAEDIHFIPQLRSTNQLLAEQWKQEPGLSEACALVSFNQTAGRGQQNNSWESEAGKNIAYSVFLRPVHINPNNSFVLSQAVSLATVELLDTLNIKASIKWPNDIYVQDKKIAGILIENLIQGKSLLGCIAGIGLNVNQEHFTSDAPNPVSIVQLCGQNQDLHTLTLSLHRQIGAAYADTCGFLQDARLRQ